MLGKVLPVNRGIAGSKDLLLRELDCAVIERIHQYNREKDERPYDSVRECSLREIRSMKI